MDPQKQYSRISFLVRSYNSSKLTAAALVKLEAQVSEFKDRLLNIKKHMEEVEKEKAEAEKKDKAAAEAAEAKPSTFNVLFNEV